MRMLLPVGRSGWAIVAGYFGLFAVRSVPAPIALVLGIGRRPRHQKARPKARHGPGRFWTGHGHVGLRFPWSSACAWGP